MVRKTIAVSQMATVLGWTLTAVRECIARDKFPFAYAWQSPGYFINDDVIGEM